MKINKALKSYEISTFLQTPSPVPGHLSSAAKYPRCSDTRQVSPVLCQNGWSEQPSDIIALTLFWHGDTWRGVYLARRGYLACRRDLISGKRWHFWTAPYILLLVDINFHLPLPVWNTWKWVQNYREFWYATLQDCAADRTYNNKWSHIVTVTRTRDITICDLTHEHDHLLCAMYSMILRAEGLTCISVYRHVIYRWKAL